jgi:hypothetical protein
MEQESTFYSMHKDMLALLSFDITEIHQRQLKNGANCFFIKAASSFPNDAVLTLNNVTLILG